MTFSQDPPPDYFGFGPRRSASWRINDDGSTSLTGIQPETYGYGYLDPRLFNMSCPTNLYDMTAWDCVVTETSIVTALTGYNLFIDSEGTQSYILLTNTST